jgi:hypothetical protein
MGGGGAVRAAAKVTGFGITSGGIRGVPAMPPAEQSVRNASRPVSAILSTSSSEPVKAGSIDASAAHISAAWDDWEFAGEELSMASEEPKPRVVFGGAPSFQEAKEATIELKDALEKYNFDKKFWFSIQFLGFSCCFFISTNYFRYLIWFSYGLGFHLMFLVLESLKCGFCLSLCFHDNLGV